MKIPTPQFVKLWWLKSGHSLRINKYFKIFQYCNVVIIIQNMIYKLLRVALSCTVIGISNINPNKMFLMYLTFWCILDLLLLLRFVWCYYVYVYNKMLFVWVACVIDWTVTRNSSIAKQNTRFSNQSLDLRSLMIKTD